MARMKWCREHIVGGSRYVVAACAAAQRSDSAEKD